MNDEPLRSAIELLRGEWAEHTGGSFETEAISADDLLSGDGPSADVVVFPSRYLGELCEEDRLRPMRQSVLESPDVGFGDFFPAIRDRVIAHGGRTMALPIGCPVPLIVAQASDASPGPPDTWTDIPESALGVVAPDGADRFKSAYLLLARAASSIDDSARDTMLFDPDTMSPRLSTPPFMRALEQMAAARASDGDEPAVSVSWPLRADENPDERAADLAVAPLPGAREIFDTLSGDWTTAEGPPQRVTLLATSGRLVGVPTSSRNAAVAFRLAGWLAGGQNARQLATASPSVARVRRSQARLPDDWLGGGDAGAARAFAAAQSDSLGNERVFVVPGIVRIDDYLAALDSAVEDALAGRATAHEALDRAAAAWAEITEAVGAERQRRAYLRRLGIESYEPPRA